jgi:hypothetical protein
MTSIRLPYVQEYRDRHGKVRRYFRRPGFQRVTLPGTPGSPQFMAAYKSALADERLQIRRKHGDGTVGDLVASFYQSAAFDNLKPSSQRAYRHILDRFAEKDGHRLVRDMPRRVAVSIIEEIGATRPGAANLTLKVMRRLFAYAVKKELRSDNPFAGIETYKLGTHHTWTDAEIAAYEAVWPVGTRQRLAFDLLLYTGQRVGDVAAWRRSDVRNAEIHFVQEKAGSPLNPAASEPSHVDESVPRKGAGAVRANERASNHWRRPIGSCRACRPGRWSACKVRPARGTESADAALGRAREHQTDRVGIGPQDAEGSRALHGSGRPSPLGPRHHGRTKRH